MIYLQLAAGLALLIVGGDLLVRGAVDLARHLGVSPLLIGLTLVGFGTSTPELVASIQAALAGSPGIAVGNVVGSNICNILLILGLAAVFHPLATPRAAFMRDGGMMLVAAIICTALVLMGRLDRPVRNWAAGNIGGLCLLLLSPRASRGRLAADRRSRCSTLARGAPGVRRRHGADHLRRGAPGLLRD